MKRYLPIVTLIFLVIVFRILGSVFSESMPNFQPVAALFFCGVFFFKGWKAWGIPLIAWLISYPAPAIISGDLSYLGPLTLFTTGLGFAATFAIGYFLRKRGIGMAVLGSLAAAIAFHLITNGVIWLASPLYPNTLYGLYQSVWAGYEGSVLPSWVFLRNMIGSNALFTALLMSANFSLPSFSEEPESTEAEAR